MEIKGLEDLAKFGAPTKAELEPFQRIAAAAFESVARMSNIFPDDEYKEIAIAIIKGRAMGEPDMAALKSLEGVAEQIGEERNRKWRNAWLLWLEVEKAAAIAIAEKMTDPSHRQDILRRGEKAIGYKLGDAVSMANYFASEILAAYVKIAAGYESPSIEAAIPIVPEASGRPRDPWNQHAINRLLAGEAKPKVRTDWRAEFKIGTGVSPYDTKEGEAATWQKRVWQPYRALKGGRNRTK